MLTIQLSIYFFLYLFIVSLLHIAFSHTGSESPLNILHCDFFPVLLFSFSLSVWARFWPPATNLHVLTPYAFNYHSWEKRSGSIRNYLDYWSWVGHETNNSCVWWKMASCIDAIFARRPCHPSPQSRKWPRPRVWMKSVCATFGRMEWLYSRRFRLWIVWQNFLLDHCCCASVAIDGDGSVCVSWINAGRLPHWVGVWVQA